MPKINLTIDGRPLQADAGLTIIQVAHEHGIVIPYYCYHPGLVPDGNCRICLVEVEKAPKLMVGCKTPIAEGMVVHTKNEKVDTARQGVQEFMLANHPIDCPVCDQAGECKLQDYYYDYNLQQSRFRELKQHKPKVQPLGEHVMFDGERCIMCSRCVRFTADITGTNELGLFNRGDRTQIGMVEGVTLDNPYSLNVVDICPVGALTSRDFRFRKRVWFLEERNQICTGCARGCVTVHDVEPKENKVYRVKPRKNLAVNQFWMCDDGRFVPRRYETNRLTHTAAGKAVKQDQAVAAVARVLSDNHAKAGSVLFVLSPQLSTQDAFAAAQLAKAYGAAVAIGQGRSAEGYQVESDSLLIVADKNPNRAGVRLALGQEGLALVDVDAKIGSTYSTVVLVGDHAEGGLKHLSKATTLVVVAAIMGSTMSQAAVTIGATSPMEQEILYVNVDGIAQASTASLRPAADVATVADVMRKVSDAASVAAMIQPDALTQTVKAVKGLDSVDVAALRRPKPARPAGQPRLAPHNGSAA